MRPRWCWKHEYVGLHSRACAMTEPALHRSIEAARDEPARVRRATAMWLQAIAWMTLVACWFFTIDVQPLFEPDEGRYAEIPREMWVSGDWITPRLNDIKYFEKPPLQYWATAVSYSIFGVKPWSSRLWAYWLAFACIPMTFAFARTIHGTRAGIAAALVLSTNPLYVLVGHFNLLDSAFMFFTTAAVFAFLMSRHTGDDIVRERRWMLLTWASLACAVLTKGVAALVLAGATVVVYSALARDGRLWRRWHVAAGLGIFAVIAVPWFILVTLRNPEFPGFFFVHEHFARFLTTVHGRAGPWWYFLPLTLVAVAPWIASLARSLRIAWRGDSASASPSVTQRVLLVWCVTVLVFFSISQSKLPPYIVPAMPALSVLLGIGIAADDSAAGRAAWINCGLVVLLGAALAGYTWSRTASIPARMIDWSVLAVVAAASGVLLVRGGRWFEPRRAVGFACTSIVAWQALIMSFVALPPPRTAQDLVRAVRPFISRDEPLYSVGEYRQSIAPYLGRTLRLVAYRGEFDFGLRNDVVPYIPTLDAFVTEWRGRPDAVAFVSLRAYDELVRRGTPMRKLASDGRSVVVSRR